MTIKITLTMGLAAITLLSATGQTAQDALYNMNREALTAENVLVDMEYSIKKDNHKKMEIQIHDLQKTLGVLYDLSANLQKVHYEGLTEKINDMKTTVYGFEEIIHKSKWFDKDKELKSEFGQLKIKLTSIKSDLDFIQIDLDYQVADEQKEQAHQEGHQASEGRHKAMDNIKLKATELKTQVKKVATALKEGNYKDVAIHSRHIQQLCTEIAAFNENLAASERSAIATSLVAIKKKAVTLEALALEGNRKHDKTHYEFEAIKIEFAKFNTQINALN
jgi:hypothetical protein